MIDTLNAGQTCRQCKHYHDTWIRADRFFGDIPVIDYCDVFKRQVDKSEGEECKAFLRRLFSNVH